jgi:hypothetical protein
VGWRKCGRDSRKFEEELVAKEALKIAKGVGYRFRLKRDGFSSIVLSTP